MVRKYVLKALSVCLDSASRVCSEPESKIHQSFRYSCMLSGTSEQCSVLKCILRKKKKSAFNDFVVKDFFFFFRSYRSSRIARRTWRKREAWNFGTSRAARINWITR